MARRNWSASPAVNPAATMASSITCSWKIGTPRVRSSTLVAHGIVRVGDGLEALAAAQVGMHHVALDRAGPDDGHLDDEIVEALGAQPRQHGHLRAGLHLEHADAVGALQHPVYPGILRRDLLHRKAAPAEVVDEAERLADRRQHAEAEHVHLQQAEGFEVVLVPLDDGAVVHGRVLDRHEFGQGPARDDEAADVLREVPREAEYLVDEVQELTGDPALGSMPAAARRALIESRPSHQAMDFASRSTRSRSSPSALPTSRIALRGR